jgi:hypothetical protein
VLLHRKLVWSSLVLLTVLHGPATAWATPSTTYWAPSVATCQGYKLPHITYDTYYGKAAAYPIDTGLTMGVLPGDKVQAEVGYDLLFPGQNPTQFYLNGKICLPENSLGKGVPAFSFGIYNVGFKSDVTDFDTVYVMAQKTLPIGGYISGGAYFGASDILFTNSDGNVAKAGALVGWSSPDIKVGLKGLSKITVIGDVQTGKNIFGAGGVGADIYFTDSIALIIGPVFYFDRQLQPGASRVLWTTQLDVDIPLGR